MGGFIHRTGLGLAVLAGCVGGPVDPVARALQHGRTASDTVGGPVVLAGVDKAPDAVALPQWWVGGAEGGPPNADAGYALVFDGGERKLWRLREPADAPSVSVAADAVLGALAEPTWLKGFVQHGPAAVGGELVATLFIQPPARSSRRPCVSVAAHGDRLSLGELLGGQADLIPGAGPQPIVAHRVYASVPPAWLVGDTTLSVHLHECGSDLDFGDPTSVPLTVASSGRPTAGQLTERPYTTDPTAKWAQIKGRKESLHRKPDGSVEVRPAPPLPRVLRGEAWGLLVVGPVDPRDWSAPDGTVGPLDPLAGLLQEADAAVLSWDAVATRHGEAPAGVVPRRSTPEMMKHASKLDFQGIYLSSHGVDVGLRGVTDSATSARMLGLLSGGTSVDLDVGEGDSAVSVRVSHFQAGDSLYDLVRAERSAVGDALLLVEVTGVEDPVAAEKAVREAGVDGAWFVSDSIGRVSVKGGVPVLLGIPPLDSAHSASVVARWYLAQTGVTRVDLQSVVNNGGRWNLDREGAGRQAFLDAAALGQATSTYLAVGQNVAAVDVLGHGPDRSREPAVVRGFVQPEPSELPPPMVPARCRVTEGVFAGVDVPVGDDLHILRAKLIDAEGPVIEAEVLWRADRPLPAGSVRWYVGGLSIPWRATTIPCEGSWGFDAFEPGYVIRDRVRLQAPEGIEPGSGDLTLEVRLGGERPMIGDERRLNLGTITLP
ncbi:MAG: hypothetical protein AB8H79_15555 [Myxococcota bacterium]